MSVPKYKEIIDVLNEELGGGKLHQGDKFYSESEICSRFNVSSTTAVKVLNVLQQQNKVTRIKGKGTFVAKENHKSVVLYTDLNMSNGHSEGVKVLNVEIKNDKTVLKKMGLHSSDKYLKVTRIRCIGEKTSQYSVSNIRLDYIDKNKLDDDSNFDSVYSRIKEDAGLDPYKLPYTQKTTISKVKDSNILNYFNGTNDLYIYQERLTYLPTVDNSILEYAYTYKLPEFWGMETESVFGGNI